MGVDATLAVFDGVGTGESHVGGLASVAIIRDEEDEIGGGVVGDVAGLSASDSRIDEHPAGDDVISAGRVGVSQGNGLGGRSNGSWCHGTGSREGGSRLWDLRVPQGFPPAVTSTVVAGRSVNDFTTSEAGGK